VVRLLSHNALPINDYEEEAESTAVTKKETLTACTNRLMSSGHITGGLSFQQLHHI